MKDRKAKSASSSANRSDGLTIFDAPNVCREMMAKCSTLAKQADPAVAKGLAEIEADAKRMLDAIVASVDLLLANPV